jgi:hypothetical protein
MKFFKQVAILSVSSALILVSSFTGISGANAAVYSYYSLNELDNEEFIFGDQLKIQSEFCWVTNKNHPKYPTKIETKINGKWVSAGSSKFSKDKTVCSKAAYPYLKTFLWTPNQVGTFEIRNKEKSPYLSATITVRTRLATPSTSASSAAVSPSTAPVPSIGGNSSSLGINKATCSFKGQKLYGSVFVTDREIFSDFTVYITDRESFSDISVYKADRESFANKCGLWYFTDREIFSDFTIYVTDREIFSDFTIYVTGREIFAGIKR